MASGFVPRGRGVRYAGEGPRRSRGFEPERTMMRALIASLLVVAGSGLPAFAVDVKIVKGLDHPESVAVGPGGKVYVTLIGERDKPGDGSIVIVDPDEIPTKRITPFVTGLDDPKGLVAVGDFLFVTDVRRVWRVDDKGRAEVFVGPEDFPRTPIYLNDVTYDGVGSFYVSDSGDRYGRKGAVFRIFPDKKVTLVLDGEFTMPPIAIPNGLLMDDPDHFFIVDYGQGGYLYRYSLLTSTAQRLGFDIGGADGIARGPYGGLFLSDRSGGRIFRLTSELEPIGLLADRYKVPGDFESTRFRSPADVAATPDGKYLLIPDVDAGALIWLPITPPVPG